MGSLEDLTTLRALVAAEPRVAAGVDDYCLLLGEPDEFGDWTDCPPRIGVPFARDGTEHEFCLLESDAVVLYTPLADEPHVVVGADLREFLALLLHGNGAQVGGLAYDRDEVVEEMSGELEADEELSDEERHALARLTEVFDLRRWPDVGVRLRELQSLLPPA